MRSFDQNTGQSEQAAYLTWAFGDLTWGLVYCTREITLARTFFLAFGLNYDGSRSLWALAQLFHGISFEVDGEKVFPKQVSGASRR